MRRLPLRITTTVAALCAALAPARIDAQRLPASTRCGVGVPESEATGFVTLPRGDVFCPLVADPKGLRSFVSYQRGDSDSFAENIGAVGIGDSFGLFRFGGRSAGEGVQLSLSGSVFAQFDLGTSSFDLINADYLIALPLTVRWSGLSARLRIYHQSSHLGDEFLLRGDVPEGELRERENLSFESAEGILSQDLGFLRLYAGGEYLFNREPEELEAMVAHAGAELRPLGMLVRFGNAGGLGLVAAVDVKSSEEQDWEAGVSVRAGFEVGRPRETEVPSRRWSLLFEFYDGPSPYGQFFRDDISYYGVGLHFTP
jgi:hypothetical protein